VPKLALQPQEWHTIEDDDDFVPMMMNQKASASAFGENLNAAQVGRALQNKGHNDKAKSQQAATTGVAFAEIVRKELEQKQRIIEELTAELRMHTEATQVCGADIRMLREEQIRLMNKIDSLEQEKRDKAAAEANADKLTSEILRYPHLMHEQDKDTLIRNVQNMRDKVNALERDRTALQDALGQAKTVIKQFATLKQEHHSLQEAHQEQSKYLMKMQKKITQISAYQETIQTQEKVISKMQGIIETKMRAKNALPFSVKPPTHLNAAAPNPVPPNSQIPQFSATPPPAVAIPDFAAIQAQKETEEQLVQARQEIAELTDKVSKHLLWVLM
jgi:chromosome segregation ATPase